MASKRRAIEEYGPLGVFFVLNLRGAEWLGLAPEQSLFVATGGFMLALALSMISTLTRGAKLNNMTVLSGGFVFVFGGLTLFLQDEMFIKIKPTLIYLIFAAALGFGLLRKQSYLQRLMGQALPLTDAGWMVLTKRWLWFFLFLAGLNELVWRTQTTDMWVNFKVFGILPLTVLFMAAQISLLTTYKAENSD